jgi:GAF domain-containing protein
VEPVTDLVIAISNPAKSLQYKRQSICIKTMEAISFTNRVSLWAFNESLTQIECLMCLEQKNKVFSSGQILSKTNYPDYFDAILAQQVLVASDARNHPSTRCFNESYFIPNDIQSLLDYVLIKDNRPMGVICCEAIGKKHQWLESDVVTLRRIANITAIFFEQD